VVCALVVLATTARADEVPKFRNKGDIEKKFVSEAAVAIVKAAHFTAKDPALEKYKFEEVKKGRTKLEIRASYKGKVSGKEYFADIVIHLDTLDKGSWEVLRIEYSDNNNIPYSRKKVDALIKKFNRK
jgi:hypothetical protein